MERGRDQFNKIKPLINIMIKLYMIFNKNTRVKLFEYHRGTKGKKGLLIRYVLLKTIAQNVGENVAIFPDAHIYNADRLSIGSNVSIHPMSYLEAIGGITIGDNVSIAHGVTILSVNHVFKDLNIPIRDQGLELTPCNINSNVWIGAKASVLSGTTIESGSIIAAGAVVTKNVRGNVVVGGVPARIIKNRDENPEVIYERY